MIYSKKTLLVDMISETPSLLEVLDRLGLPFEFGTNTLESACVHSKIDIDFALLIVNVYSHRDYFPQDELRGFPVEVIVDYLHKTHVSYLVDKLPHLKEHYEGIKGVKDMEIISSFFMKMERLFRSHFEEEESILFPYVLALSRHQKEETLSKEEQEVLKRYSLKKYLHHHTDIYGSLSDFQNILLRFVLPTESSKENYVQTVKVVAALKTDMAYHSRIEERVLIPLVEKIEQKIRMKRVRDQIENGGVSVDKDSANELSQRETAVLKCIASGLLNKEIAMELNISEHTVKTHRKNIMAKLGVHSTAGLTTYAILNKLLVI